MTQLAARLRRQETLSDSLTYLLRYVARRGPAAAQRWWRTYARAVKPQAVASVGVLVNGGVGDHIIAARFLRDLFSSDEPFTFDIFSSNPGFSSWIFANVPGFRNCHTDTAFRDGAQHYAVSLDISAIVSIRHQSFASTLLKKPLAKVTTFNAEMKFCLTGPTRMDGFLAQKLQFNNATRAQSLHSIAGIPYGGDEFPLPTDEACLPKFNLTGKRYVTVHNGFEANFITAGAQPTKCYPHFDQVIQLLKLQFPHLLFVQIGAQTSLPLPHADLNLIGKTTLPEASSLIRSAAAHLDNESGMVHIASCFGVPCTVVFGPTPADYFSYPRNISLRPKTCGGCWWITADWMERCPRGFAQPPCTYTQTPAEVAQAASLLLTQAKAKSIAGGSC